MAAKQISHKLVFLSFDFIFLCLNNLVLPEHLRPESLISHFKAYRLT